MKLLEVINCPKGITLNSQLVDLLMILDEDIPAEEQDQKITEYLQALSSRESDYLAAQKKDAAQSEETGVATKSNQIKYIISETIDSISEIPAEQKEKLKHLYLQAVANYSFFDSTKMQQFLLDNGISPEVEFNGVKTNIVTRVLQQAKNLDLKAKEGILTLTPDKVRMLYAHLFENGSTYDRVTFDESSKYSSYVSFDGKTYAPDRLDRMVRFCENHGMKSKINSFMMYCDFPKQWDSYLQWLVKNGDITEDERKQKLKSSLIEYVSDVSQKYGDRIDCIDIFNELIYDPHMSEPGFAEEPSYHPRTEGWQKYLSLEDLCEMALVARKAMPNVNFTYNDMNWTNPEKRKEIINILKRIQNIEEIFKTEGIVINGKTVTLGPNERLIDSIGFESHLTTGADLEEIDHALEDVSVLGLPVEVTELDVARTGKNPLSPSEINKQNTIFRKFRDLAQTGKISALTIWSQSDELSFMNDKCGHPVFASLLDSNFQEKDIDRKVSFIDSLKNSFRKMATFFARQPDVMHEKQNAQAALDSLLISKEQESSREQ